MGLIFWNVLIAAAFGIATVALPFPFVSLAIWLGALFWSVRKQHGARPTAKVVLQAATMVLIIVAAIKAPVKTTERFLTRTIELPKTTMTLAEIESSPTYGPAPHWLPVSIHVKVEPDEQSTEIAFPSTEITVREFVSVIESQSTLRHRFGHCGNGSTILHGGDCSFGLSLRRPR
jgi:hypothetical protein